MNIREELEYQEHRRLNPMAAFSDRSAGRPTPYQPNDNDVRTCYQRDGDRIVHCKAFRRLMHKTQVFLRPEGDHYRTRMTHTLEVSRITSSASSAFWVKGRQKLTTKAMRKSFSSLMKGAKRPRA